MMHAIKKRQKLCIIETDLRRESCFSLVVTENISIMMTVAANTNEKHAKQWEERGEKSYKSDSWPKLTQDTAKTPDKHHLN